MSKAVGFIESSASSDWKSLWIANAVGFLCAVQFSIFFTSVWPYLQMLHGTVTELYFSLTVAAYSLFQLLLSPLYGHWSNRCRTFRLPIACGCAVMIVGDFVYALALIPHSGWSRVHMVLAGRALMGAGSAMTGVLCAYVATASTSQQRHRAVSLYTASFVSGVAIGPALQVAFTPLDHPGWVLWGPVQVNMYTAPAYTGALTLLVCIVLLFTVFHEQHAGLISESAKKDRFFYLPKYDRLAVVACLATWFAMSAMSTNMEVILVPYAMIIYGWDSNTAIKRMSIVVLVYAIISLIGYVLLGTTRIGKFNERKLILLGLTMFVLFHVVSYPMPFYSGVISPKVANFTHGCDYSTHDWCKKTPVVPVGVFATGYLLLVATGAPCISSPNNVLYSKILGPRRQGTMQGVMVLVGSSARTVAPIAMTWLFQNYGPMMAWPFQMALQLCAIAGVLVCYSRLVPLTDKQLKAGQCVKYKHGRVYRF